MMSRHVINSSFYVNEKRNETKRGSDRLGSSGMRFFVLHTYTFTVIGKAVYFVLYSIHGVYTGRDPQIPEIPKKAEYLK